MSKPRAAEWRVDIQALRGLAVLLVVADHAGLPFLRGGFLGVDIFFVISGFLMTRLIVSGLDSGTFTLRQFYERRARRLLPAAYATVAITAVLAVFLLDPFEFRNFAQQVVGAFTFSTNLILWKQVDYFNSASDLKPLLHMWSLAVEEQYYIVIPFILLWCPTRLRLAIGIVLALTSLVLCLYFVQRSPSATFYFLPFRAWELGLGSIAALVVHRYGVLEFGGIWFRAACTTLLLVISVFATSGGHPGWLALVVCFATGFLMMSGRPQPTAGILKGVTWVGDRSYTLYLVHWPVLAFANNVYIDHPPGLIVISLLIVIFLWMELQYRFVERYFRARFLTARSMAVLIGFPMAILISVLFWSYYVDADGVDDRHGNVGLSKDCDFRGNFIEGGLCESAPHPQILVWGDSFAMHLVNGIQATSPNGVTQATRTVCGPFLGLAPLDDEFRQRSWAEQCIRFNQSVFDHLKAHPEIKTVVLSSVLKQYVPGAEPDKRWRFMIHTYYGFQEVAQTLPVLESALQNTVIALQAIGKRVVLVAPPPSSNFDIGRCLGRESSGKPLISSHKTCEIPLNDYKAARKPVLAFLTLIAERHTVPVISFDQLLCDESLCRTRLSGTALYSDSGHFSAAGSREIGVRMDLSKRIAEVAR